MGLAIVFAIGLVVGALLAGVGLVAWHDSA